MDIRQVVHITLADQAPKIIDGYWHEWVNGEWVNTGVKAEGEDGADGKDGYTPIKGTDYFDGKDGQDGSSEHLHVRYSNFSDGANFNTSPTNKKYIGIATSNSGTAPTDKSKYNWTLIKGTDGVKGEKGADGESRYLHIKYSNNGTSFTSNNGETLGSWIGMYVDAIKEDSNIFSDYTWRKVDGEDGKDGAPGEDGKDGKDGVDGKDGENPRPEDMPIGYMAGKWSEDGYKGEPYKRTKTSFPIVELNKYYYYLIRNFTGMNHLTPPNQDFGTPTSHWALADNFDMIIAEAVVSKFGKIGGAVFVGANLISQWGLDENGNQVDTCENYGLKNSDGIPLFTPNLDFDFFDGIIKMGRNIKMGVENGRSLLTFYDDNGLPIYDLSPNGISEISARSSSWTPMHLIYLGANYEYVLKNSVPKSKYKNSNKESAEAVTYYRYTSKMVAGQVTDEPNDGVIFTNKSTTSTRIPIGIYCEKIVGMHGEYLADGELPDMHEHNETVSLNSPIYFKHLWQPFNGRKGAEVIAYWNE